MVTDRQKELINKLCSYDNIESNLMRLLSEINTKLRELRKIENLTESKIQEERRQLEKERSDIQDIISQKTIGFPWLADAISQYYETQDLKIAEFMEKKLRPGITSADRIRELAKEKREYQKKFIIARNIAKYYEALFPWLSDFVDENIDDTLLKAFTKLEIDDSIDPINNYITK